MTRSAALLATVALLASAAAPSAAQDGPATAIYLVRHAEKADEPAADPPLTPTGMARAQALANVLADAGIHRVFSTQFLRTRSTAEPLARRLGLEIRTIRPGSSIAEHAREVADSVRGMPGRAALVVGHSNTIPAIIEALGAPDPGPIADDSYGDLFVVILQDGRAPTLTRARYGT